MADLPIQFVSIVPRVTRLGRRLSRHTDFGLRTLCSDFNRRFATEITIEERVGEPYVHDAVWLDFPYFEITFHVQRFALVQEFTDLAFDSRLPKPEK